MSVILLVPLAMVVYVLHWGQRYLLPSFSVSPGQFPSSLPSCSSCNRSIYSQITWNFFVDVAMIVQEMCRPVSKQIWCWNTSVDSEKEQNLETRHFAKDSLEYGLEVLLAPGTKQTRVWNLWKNKTGNCVSTQKLTVYLRRITKKALKCLLCVHLECFWGISESTR